MTSHYKQTPPLQPKGRGELKNCQQNRLRHSACLDSNVLITLATIIVDSVFLCVSHPESSKTCSIQKPETEFSSDSIKMELNILGTYEEMADQDPSFSFIPLDPEWAQPLADLPIDGLPRPSFEPYSVPEHLLPTTSLSSLSTSSQTSPHDKVPIPRLAPVSTSPRRKRSAWACKSCRQKKMKCSGDHPTCQQCLATDASCVYQDIKRVRDQRKLSALSSDLERYKKLLHDIEHLVDQDTKKYIRKTLCVCNALRSTLYYC